MSYPSLPESTWVPVTTRRLRRPQVLWTSADAISAGFDPEQVYCCPKDDEAADRYTDETRQEGADRYGGIGVGSAGGSGRCSTFTNGLQTKGVGVTSLVAPNADRFHSSGTLTLLEASLEAVYASVYAHGLPFGAVPIHAIVLTGEKIPGAYEFEPDARPPRALAIRPFVHRPAHYLRNMLHPPGRLPAGVAGTGLTLDTTRTRSALTILAANLKAVLGFDAGDEVLSLDQGMRELVRRYAYQAAACFAKRMPHGSISCSNISLSGAYLDFGLSGHVPSYRRFTWNPSIPDSWEELYAPVRTLRMLLGQLRTYHPAFGLSSVMTEEELVALYADQLERRLAVEMAKMTGLSEEMTRTCSETMLLAALRVKREVWSRGTGERSVGFSFPGRSADGKPMPPPRSSVRHDLNAIMTAVGGLQTAEDIDQAIAPWLPDAALRQKYVVMTMALRNKVLASVGQDATLFSYIGSEAVRKNSSLDFLRRNTVFDKFREKEIQGDHQGAASIINDLIARARYIICDTVSQI